MLSYIGLFIIGTIVTTVGLQQFNKRYELTQQQETRVARQPYSKRERPWIWLTVIGFIMMLSGGIEILIRIIT